MSEAPVMTRHFCLTPMGHVHYVDVGPRDGVPIALLHQTPRSIDEFADVIPYLSPARRVIAIDTPGYGCSDHPVEQPTIADYARAVLDVLDAAGTTRVVVAGHHTGAVIAIEIAAACPARVAGIALSGPIYLDEQGRRDLAAYFAQWHVRPDGSHLTEKWEKFARWTTNPALIQRLVVDLFLAGETSEFGHFAAGDYRMEDRLPLVQCPGLLMFGRRDPFASPAMSGPFRDVFPAAHEASIDAGIFSPNEAPEAWARAVTDFCDGIGC
jgi:pimeloyl-ACP methyl ester carboxylesterase